MLADELRMDEVQSGSYSGPEGGFSSFTRSVLRTRFAEISFGSIPTMRQARTYLAAHDFGPQSVGWPTKREQIVFAPLAGLRDGRRFAPCSFVFEQSFEYADGGMERRAPAFGCFAVPAAIFELLAQESIGQYIVRFLEIRAPIRSERCHQNQVMSSRLFKRNPLNRQAELWGTRCSSRLRQVHHLRQLVPA